MPAKSFMIQAPGFQLCVKIFVLFQFSQNFFFFVSQMLKVSSRVWLKKRAEAKRSSLLEKILHMCFVEFLRLV
jgi:hypothetical protein